MTVYRCNEIVLQGEVWEALQGELKAIGKTIAKPRHAAGYEVEAVVKGVLEPLLIEIKTGRSAADIFAGIGQLMLYRQLLPSLRKHRAILLVPEGIRPVLVKAAEDIHITVETYTRQGPGGKKVVFADSFRVRCGLPSVTSGAASAD